MITTTMGLLRRRKFRELVARQLSLFEADHGVDVARAREARAEAGRATDTHDELEHYARFEDLSEDIQDALEDMCEHYGRSLEAQVVADYVREFERQAKAAYGDVVPRLQFPFWD
jgi:hypothetical protein